MKELVLFRGCPGSGKSTLASILCGIVVSADDYFTDPKTGDYNFNAAKLKQAHASCADAVEKHMEAEINVVGVANTFTVAWEMQPYFDLAKKYGYRIHTVVVENRHMSNDVHDVPTQEKNKMKQRFQVVL
jgi:predicted kinase